MNLFTNTELRIDYLCHQIKAKKSVAIWKNSLEF